MNARATYGAFPLRTIVPVESSNAKNGDQRNFVVPPLSAPVELGSRGRDTGGFIWVTLGTEG